VHIDLSLVDILTKAADIKKDIKFPAASKPRQLEAKANVSDFQAQYQDQKPQIFSSRSRTVHKNPIRLCISVHFTYF